MNATHIKLLLSKLPDAKKNANGWSARCPAHDDRSPSLSVSEGDDGRVLVCCHADCTVEAICSAVGLCVADLMPNASKLSTSTQPRQTGKKQQYRRQQSNKPTTTYLTRGVAIVTLEQKLGKASAKWTYHDAQGDPVGVIVRWDKPLPDCDRADPRCQDGMEELLQPPR